MQTGILPEECMEHIIRDSIRAGNVERQAVIFPDGNSDCGKLVFMPAYNTGDVMPEIPASDGSRFAFFRECDKLVVCVCEACHLTCEQAFIRREIYLYRFIGRLIKIKLCHLINRDVVRGGRVNQVVDIKACILRISMNLIKTKGFD